MLKGVKNNKFYIIQKKYYIEEKVRPSILILYFFIFLML
jgi:hypothetical protein